MWSEPSHKCLGLWDGRRADGLTGDQARSMKQRLVFLPGLPIGPASRTSVHPIGDFSSRPLAARISVYESA